MGLSLTLIWSVASVASVMAVGVVSIDIADKKELEQHIKDIPGLKKDIELFSKCGKVEFDTFKEELDAAVSCKNETDYRCYWGCKMKMMGINSTSEGQKKYGDYLSRKVEDKLDKSTTYAKNIPLCLIGPNKVKPYMDCPMNNVVIRCIMSLHSKICYGDDAKIPEVPQKLTW